MQFPNLDDEDGDFGISSTSRSKLSSLFQTERSSVDVNQALTFTAPKQPKKTDGSQQSQGTLKLIHASAVQAYKLIDGNYTNLGKLGCALLGLHETNSYRLLLYKGKQVQVSTCNILPSFQFHVQSNNYATFYDDKKENWSLLFESESSLFDFGKQIALAKANSQDKSQLSLVIQDLVQGDGPSLEIGDSSEVKYTGWLLTNNTLGQVFDSNMNSESAFRMRLGKKVIKGWSEGLVGAQKGTKRILIIPPHLAYGAEGMGSAVPPNSSLVFEIHVIKVKKSRDSSHSPSPLKAAENVPEKKPEVLPRHSITSEDNIRLRGASISEQLAQSPKKDKAQLISRMAKMGTATLPFQGAIAAQVSSDSENEEENQPEKPAPAVSQGGSRTASPKPPSRPSSRKNSEPIITSQPVQLQSVQETSPFHSSQQPSPVQYYPPGILANQSYPAPVNFPIFQPQISQYPLAQTQYPMHTVPGMVPPVTSSLADTHIPMLVTETRSQNAEVRLSLSKITDKVDTVIQKIDNLNFNQGRSNALSHSSFMDSAILVQSIEKIVQENSQLKEDNEVKNNKIQSLNEKICDLLQRNQRFFEESNSMLEHKSDSFQAFSADSQAKLLNLEKEKTSLSIDLSNALTKLSAMESELKSYKTHENELLQKLQEKERRIEEIDSELLSFKRSAIDSENSSQLNALQIEVKNLEEEKSLLKSQIMDWEEKYNNLNKCLAEKTKELQELHDRENSEVKNSNTEYDEKIEVMKKSVDKAVAEKEELNIKIRELQAKLMESQKSESVLKEKLSSLQSELKNSLVWKEKYEIFYQKTRQLKENYENQIQRLMTELKQAQTSAVTTNSSDVSGAIKKVMNVLYKLLQGKFEPNTSYTGSQVLETTLQAIRGLTFQMLQNQETRSESMANDTNSAKSADSAPETDTDGISAISEVNNKVLANNDVSSDIKENGIAENESVSSIKLPVSEKSSNPTTDDKSLPTGNSTSSDSQLPDKELIDNNPSELAVQSPKGNIDSGQCGDTSAEDPNSINSISQKSSTEENKNESKSQSNVSDKSKVSENRASPEIWKPQPPPLFDDDDEEDDDDWLN